MFSLLRTAGNSGTKIGLRGIVLNRCQFSTSSYAMSKIIYTECDEAPMLATFSLLPVIQRFAKPMGIEVSEFLHRFPSFNTAMPIFFFEVLTNSL